MNLETTMEKGELRSLILYEDADLLVVNKPAGIPVVPDGWETDSPCLVKMLEEHLGKIWVIHRLDKVTSGVIVFACNAQAHRKMSMLFEGRQVSKAYHTIAKGVPAWDLHTARHPLRSDAGHKHRTVVDSARGKASETNFQVLERFKGFSLLKAIPTTGRTHQVRVHIAALGFPILGDSLYQAPGTELINRPALHAYSLEFQYEGNELAFSAPYPADMEAALKRIRAG